MTPARATAIQPLASSVAGLAAGAVLVLLWPVPLATALALLLAGAGLVGSARLTELRQQRDREQLAAGVGEVKVRLAGNALRIEALGRRLDQLPLSQADAAPTRAAISELTAEVGLLGDILQQIASTVADHEERLRARSRTANAPQPATTAAMPSPRDPVAPPLGDTASTDAERLAALAETEARRRAEIIGSALAEGRVEVHLQPVVQLPQRRTRGYEALVRLRVDEKTLLMPEDFLALVEERGFGPTLDALVLTRALAIARHLGAKGGGQFVSCNFSRTTWGSSRALAALSRILERYRDHVRHLVIEMPQTVFRALDPASLGLLGAMSATGVRFALDDVGDLRFDPIGFHDRGIRFVKVPAALLLAEDAARRTSDIAIGDLAAMLARASVTLVAVRIEDDQTVADMLELGIDHAQGNVFSPPRPVKPEIFAEPAAAPQSETALVEPAPAPIEAAAPVPPKPAKPERLPFRAVLRRAAG